LFAVLPAWVIEMSYADIPRPPVSAGKLLSIRDTTSGTFHMTFAFFFCLMYCERAKSRKGRKADAWKWSESILNRLGLV
jgi:hypothetical protein